MGKRGREIERERRDRRRVINVSNTVPISHQIIQITAYYYNYTCEAAHFSQEKVTALGVLCCFAFFVCVTLLASLFLLISH